LILKGQKFAPFLQQKQKTLENQTLSKIYGQNCAVRIYTNEVKHLFCKVNPEYAKLLFHWTHLLLVHDFSRSLKSFWLIEAVSYRSGSMLLI